MGLPIRYLDLVGCTELEDVSPLAECPELETLIIPKGVAGVEALRQHPSLKYLDDEHRNNTRTVEEFWRDYDAHR